jgi:hypothetical protein
MSTYYIFARTLPAAIFGTLAGLTVGVSSLGNILSAAPMAWAVDSFGWRETVGASPSSPRSSAIGIAALVRDPPKPEGEPRGSLLDLLAMPALWPILIAMFVCYAPAAGRARPLDQPLRGRGPRRGPVPDRHRDAGDGPCHGGGQLRLRPHRPLGRHAARPRSSSAT